MEQKNQIVDDQAAGGSWRLPIRSPMRSRRRSTTPRTMSCVSSAPSEFVALQLIGGMHHQHGTQFRKSSWLFLAADTGVIAQNPVNDAGVQNGNVHHHRKAGDLQVDLLEVLGPPVGFIAGRVTHGSLRCVWGGGGRRRRQSRWCFEIIAEKRCHAARSPPFSDQGWLTTT
jgi:hypothetical protein